MDYVLVEKRQSILLGPMPWRHRFFQSELDDLEVEYTLTPAIPTGRIQINQDLEIMPVLQLTSPPIDVVYESPVGPFWTFDDNGAYGTYTKKDNDLDFSKGHLKSVAAAERYRKENLGTTAVIQGTTVTIDTSRDGRNIFVQKYSLMGDNDTVNWKFPEGWLILTKGELGAVILAGSTYIQNQFEWEHTISQQIDNAQTAQELKNIVIVEPPPSSIV